MTDKGKERPGAAPASTYAPQAMLLGASVHPPLVDGLASAAGHSAASSSTNPIQEDTVLFRAEDVVSIHAASGEMWIAQLTQPIIMQVQTSASGERLVSFALDRVSCRYFVPTGELWSPGLEHAATWWHERGGSQHLADEAAAIARAAAFEGTHFSFEKTDRVTCSTVCGRLSTSEACLHRGKLASFAVSEASMEAAREHISTQQAAREAAEEQAQAQRAADAEMCRAAKAARVASAAAASSSRYEDLSERRATGLERQRDSKR